jgi:hypothetical protein
LVLIFINFELGFREDVSVLISQLKDGAIVWLVVSLLIRVSRGPLVIIKLESENAAMDEWRQLDTLLE